MSQDRNKSDCVFISNKTPDDAFNKRKNNIAIALPKIRFISTADAQ